jgi:archaellum component FlaC
MPPKEPKSPIELKIDAIDRTLEVHSVRMEAIDQKLDRIADLVEANTQQVATLSEGLTRLENSVNRLESIVERGFTRLEMLISQQAETAQMQARHVDRLMGVVETLLTKVA